MYNKKKRIIIISMILLVLVIVAITFSFSADEEPVVITDEVMSLYNELNESSYKLLNSDKYLVTDGYISRILPNTKIAELKEGFNIDKDNIKIFDGEEEVTTGIVETGMILKENNNTYTLMVIGDVSKDGKLDKIDLTKIINNTKTTELDELTKKSSDINEDNIVDKTDVELAIKYIFNEGLEVKTVEAVPEPIINAIKGEETDGWYKENVKLKVSNTSEDVVKTVYLIKGTKERLETIVSDAEIEVSGYGAYKIVAYSYGKDGTRSNPVELVVGVDTDNKCIKYGVETLSECMLLNDGDYKSVEAAISGIKTKTADFSQISTTDEGLLMALDDQGESFYYRGVLEDNFVEFAGFTWRIIRRNGDGSVRMIYNGESTSASGVDSSIGTSKYNLARDDMAYLGYMYGLNQEFKVTSSILNHHNISKDKKYYYSDSISCNDELKECVLSGNLINGKWSEKYIQILNGTDENGNVPYKYTCWLTNKDGSCGIVSEIIDIFEEDGEMVETQAKVKYHGYLSKTYEDTYKDDVESNIKRKIDLWYEKNIKDKSDDDNNNYSLYLVDGMFCNDRSLFSGDGNSLNSVSYYGANRRIQTKKPSLICKRPEDKFSVGIENGNGRLKYPIATITVDEVTMAGSMQNVANTNYWLYSGVAYYTMTPSVFHTYYAQTRIYLVSPSLGFFATATDAEYNIRPVINLSKDVFVTDGDGTVSNPYKVSLSK